MAGHRLVTRWIDHGLFDGEVEWNVDEDWPDLRIEGQWEMRVCSRAAASAS
jgi:hypothetical protein